MQFRTYFEKVMIDVNASLEPTSQIFQQRPKSFDLQKH